MEKDWREEYKDGPQLKGYPVGTIGEKAEEVFKKNSEEYIKFDRVLNRRSNRPDLHAFLLLDELFPGKSDIVACAEHDEMWLDIESKDIRKLTEEQVIELIRCGVRYDTDNDSLAMFV